MVQKNFTKEGFKEDIDEGLICSGSLLELKLREEKERYACGYFVRLTHSTSFDTIMLTNKSPLKMQEAYNITYSIDCKNITHYEIHRVK